MIPRSTSFFSHQSGSWCSPSPLDRLCRHRAGCRSPCAPSPAGPAGPPRSVAARCGPGRGALGLLLGLLPGRAVLLPGWSRLLGLVGHRALTSLPRRGVVPDEWRLASGSGTEASGSIPDRTPRDGDHADPPPRVDPSDRLQTRAGVGSSAAVPGSISSATAARGGDGADGPHGHVAREAARTPSPGRRSSRWTTGRSRRSPGRSRPTVLVALVIPVRESSCGQRCRHGGSRGQPRPPGLPIRRSGDSHVDERLPGVVIGKAATYRTRWRPGPRRPRARAAAEQPGRQQGDEGADRQEDHVDADQRRDEPGRAPARSQPPPGQCGRTSTTGSAHRARTCRRGTPSAAPATARPPAGDGRPPAGRRRTARVTGERHHRGEAEHDQPQASRLPAPSSRIVIRPPITRPSAAVRIASPPRSRPPTRCPGRPRCRTRSRRRPPGYDDRRQHQQHRHRGRGRQRAAGDRADDDRARGRRRARPRRGG